MFIIMIASCGTVFANSVEGTAENLFTNKINVFFVESFEIHDSSIASVDQFKNSMNIAKFANNHCDNSYNSKIENTEDNNSYEGDDLLNEITENKTSVNKVNRNIIVDNTITEKDKDKTLNEEIVNDLLVENNQSLENKSSSKILAAGDGSFVFSQSSILSASTKAKNFVKKNGKLPNYVIIAKKQVSMSEFLYLLSKSIVNLAKKSKAGVRWENVKNPSKPSGNSINAKLKKKDYLTLAKNLVSYMEKNGKAPNSRTTSLGKVQYQTMIYAFAEILDSTRKKGVLPKHITVNTKKPANLNKVLPKFESRRENKSFTGIIHVSLANIKDAAARVESFYNTNNVLPMYVTISGIQLSMAEFLYIGSTAIVNINNSVKKDIVSIAVKNPIKENGNSKAGDIRKNNFVDLASRISTYIAKTGQAPNFGESSVGNIEFKLLVLGFSKILSHVKSNSKLPDYLTLNESGSINDNPLSIPSNSLNDRYNGESSVSFLVASPNCQVNDPAIKALATELTKGRGSDWDKAESLFNYVRDNIAYEFYFNTKYGAKNTLNRKAGNCVDQSHLLIALARSVGLAARYVNGQATFTSGSTIGHVWVQIKIDDTWVVADTTSKYNDLGAIKNWYTNTVTIHGKYASINF